MLSEYRDYRHAAKHLNSRFIKSIKGHELQAAANSLGIMVRGVMVFDSEDETSVLMDRIIYDLRRGDKNIFACLIEEHAAQDFSEIERQLLAGKSQAWYSLFAVKAANHSKGSLQMEDLINKSGPFKVYDIGMSQTAEAGILIATRLIPIQDWYMTTGVSFRFASRHAADLLGGLKRRLVHTNKPKYKIIPPEEYSSYFFREFRRLGENQVEYRDV
jgi:hypothetical protein